MKAEQEIVLQKKMIIIISLVILVLTMGMLNIQKSTVLASSKNEQARKINTNYIANEELFKVEESGDVDTPVSLVYADESQLVEIFENHVQAIKANSKEVVTVTNEVTAGEELSGDVSRETTEGSISGNVVSRGSYVRDTNVPPTEYEKVITVKATAYCLCQKCCGKLPSNPGYGYTASGLRIVPGTGMKVIAVDPSVVSLGKEVYVEGLNGAANYGYAVAADTGSAIKNYKIDLYMDTHEQALAWGVKTVNLYILKSE